VVRRVAEKLGVGPDAVALRFEGATVDAGASPASLGLEDDDTLDAVVRAS
jgi:hypothetical protein